jgi:hypothetical protein
MVVAQQWLTDNYKNKDDTIEIRIGDDVKLDGKLMIDNYLKLKNIFLNGAEGITGLKFDNCPNVEVVFVSDNKITEIEALADLAKLRKLGFSNNDIKKIDISQNKQLEMLIFFNNPKDLEFVNGIKNLSKLFFLNSNNTFAITKLLERASGADLKEIAEELKLNIDGKTPEEMKQIIKEEAAKIEQNKVKLNEKLPGLLDQTGTISDKKLEEITNNVDKGKEYQKLVDEATNTPIAEAGKIDQTKLTDQLKKAADYEKLVTDNSDLVTEDGKEIDQKKIDGLKTSSGDAANAMPILGVDNLKSDTLNTKLGNAKLSDIPDSETLKSILEKKKELEDALNNIGINPNGDDLKKNLAMLNGLRESVEGLFGKEKYIEILKVQEYESRVEINTNK